MDNLLLLIAVVLAVLVIAGVWKVFAKAGQPGWAVLIPIYNAYVLLKVAGRPGWWLVLLLIPFVSFIVAIVVAIDVARNFGRGAFFGLGLAFLGFVFYPMLGFGDAAYIGPAKG
ncbi:MAG TPA: DUF5684 domain-containing protein [Opitutaceae bacterium]|nr:DUF5684 domain-containing protein [Opitutaceae bacterium]